MSLSVEAAEDIDGWVSPTLTREFSQGDGGVVRRVPLTRSGTTVAVRQVNPYATT